MNASVCDKATQTTPRRYTFQEGDLVSLLVCFEHLLVTEWEAARQRISHEPALTYVRRRLREGVPPSRTLPTSRPLERPPTYFDHLGEKEWVDMNEEDRNVDVESMTSPPRQ